MTRRVFLATCAVGMIMAAGAFAADTKPKTVLHIIGVQWKSDAVIMGIRHRENVVERLTNPVVLPQR